MMIEAKHWRDVDLAAWRWTNFSPAELASKGDGSIKLSCATLDKLQALREWLGVPLIVTSAYRDPEHNRRVGGAKHSQHRPSQTKCCAIRRFVTRSRPAHRRAAAWP